MKQPKKLTRYQKQKLAKKNMNPDDYMVKYEDNDRFVVVPKEGRDGQETEFFK